jgi:hypothetical protein
MTAPSKKAPRLPLVLLGLMTLFSFGGPLAIGYVLRGGTSPNWPPDRAVEWLTFAIICAMVFLLMMACLSLALVNRKVGSASPIPPGEKPGVEP